MKKRNHITTDTSRTFTQLLLLFFLCGIPFIGNSQVSEKTIGDLKKEADDARKDAQSEIENNNYDCEKVMKAIKEAEDALKAITEQKEKMTPPQNKSDQSKEAKAYREAESAEKSATSDVEAAKKCAHGLVTADEIVSELEKMKNKIDKDRNLTEAEKRKLKELIDELEASAQTAAAASPCGPPEVRDAVNKKLEEQYENNRQETDRPTRELIEKWFEENFRLDVSGQGDDAKKKPRIEQDAKRKKRPFTHISTQPTGPHDRNVYFTIAPLAVYPMTSPDDKTLEMNTLRDLAFSPEVFEALFEKLGGEFFIGEISSSQNQDVHLKGSTQVMPGVRLGVGWGKYFECRAGVQYFKSSWSGTFPVMVFSEGGTQPQMLKGNLSATATGLLSEAEMACFFTNGTVKPFVKLGARAQIPLQNSSEASISGASFPIELQPLETGLAPFGGLGARIGLGNHGYTDLTGTYGKLPGAGYSPALEVAFGWKFGGK